MISVDDAIKHHISEQLTDKLPQIVAEQLKNLKPLPEWMTETELAEYWRIFDDDGKPTPYSIRRWTKREADPLPCANMGDMRRYHRETVDGWARDEAERQRRKRHKDTELHAVPKAS